MMGVEYIEYAIIVVIAFAFFFVICRMNRLRKDFWKECSHHREQHDALEEKLHDAMIENEQAIRFLNNQFAEIKAEYVKLHGQSVQEQQQSLRTIQKLEKQSQQLAASLEEANAKILDLKKQLEFFTEIRSDSMELNADTISSQLATKTNVNDSTAEQMPRLDAEQQAAYDVVMNTHCNVFITGKAGTGKSYLLRRLVLDSSKPDSSKKVLVLAPTGIAALNVQGTTIHSALGFWNLVNLDVDEINNGAIRLKSEKRQLLREVETIIIDEISMVRADTFTKIDKILQTINNTNRPFGGKQMVIFGDLFQLPPIAQKNELRYLLDTYGGRHFFHSPAYVTAQFHLFELTINHRQKEDVAFFDLLNRIREGHATEEDIKTLNSRADADITAERRIIKLFSHKADAEHVNSEELKKIKAKEYVFHCTVTYSKSDLTQNAIDDQFPIASTLRIKLGALVMMVTNDADRRWVNGQLGVVSYVDERKIKVTIDGYEYEIYPASFKQEEAIYEHGRISYQTTCEVIQYPIILAYAITIHKSQGMTYNKIACDINLCFEPGQAYVALSRCTSLNGLYLLNRVDSHSLHVDGDVVEFYQNSFC